MYNYQNERAEVFTPEGFNKIEEIKKNVKGREVFTLGEAMKGICGDSWHTMACVDWLVENGDFKYVFKEGATQNYILKHTNSGWTR